VARSNSRTLNPHDARRHDSHCPRLDQLSATPLGPRGRPPDHSPPRRRVEGGPTHHGHVRLYTASGARFYFHRHVRESSRSHRLCLESCGKLDPTGCHFHRYRPSCSDLWGYSRCHGSRTYDGTAVYWKHPVYPCLGAAAGRLANGRGAANRDCPRLDKHPHGPPN
jgi:hypothetical protein